MREEGLEGALRMLREESDEGDRLGQSSSFAFLMPEEERKQILKKYEPFRVRARLAGV